MRLSFRLVKREKKQLINIKEKKEVETKTKSHCLIRNTDCGKVKNNNKILSYYYYLHSIHRNSSFFIELIFKHR